MLKNQEFSQQLMQLYLETPFDFPDFSFKVNDKIFLSYLGKELDVRRKKFVTDFDGVFEAENTEPLYSLFFRHLHDVDINPTIDENRINSYIQSIFLGNPVTEVFAEIREYLKSKHLLKWQYDLACKRAADEWQPNEKAWQGIHEIRRLHYSLVIMSGSPQEALEMVRNKIGMEEDEVFGTRYEFDNNGELSEIQPMLSEKKLEKKREILGTESHIAVTDDIHTDYLITAGAQLSVIVTGKDDAILQNERQVYVFDKSIRKNFVHLANYVRKFEYGFIRAFETSKEQEKRILEFVRILKSTEDKTEFLDALKYLRLEIDEFDLFSSSEIENNIDEYRRTLDIEKKKRLKEVILSTLKQLPEFVNTEAFERLVM